MHNNRNNSKYVMRSDVDNMCKPNISPVKFGGDVDIINHKFKGYHLCAEGSIGWPECKNNNFLTCGELADMGAPGCIVMTDDGPQFCVTEVDNGKGFIKPMTCNTIPAPSSFLKYKTIECPYINPSPGPSPGPAPTPAPSPPGPSPGPSPGPTPKPSPSAPSAPSDPSILILGIGGGVLGLIIISLIIYYAVQRGKTKLKTSTNTTNDSSF